MTGSKAYAIGYVAQSARHEDFHRQAAEHRRAALNGTTKRSRRRLFAIGRTRRTAATHTAARTAA